MAPLASSPKSGIPEIPDLDLPHTPVQQGKPPVRRQAPEQPANKLPGVGQLSLANYKPDHAKILEGLGLPPQ